MEPTELDKAVDAYKKAAAEAREAEKAVSNTKWKLANEEDKLTKALNVRRSARKAMLDLMDKEPE